MTTTEEVSAVTPSVSAPAPTVPDSTNPAVVENVPASTVIENAPGNTGGPDVVDKSAENIVAEYAPVAGTPAFTLPAGLTPAETKGTLLRPVGGLVVVFVNA